MSLDIDLVEIQPVTVASYNITHNCIEMAKKARVYDAIWSPPENTKAADLVSSIEKAIEMMNQNFSMFEELENSKWGTANDFYFFLNRLLKTCQSNPNAMIKVSK